MKVLYILVVLTCIISFFYTYLDYSHNQDQSRPTKSNIPESINRSYIELRDSLMSKRITFDSLIFISVNDFKNKNTKLSDSARLVLDSLFHKRDIIVNNIKLLDVFFSNYERNKGLSFSSNLEKTQGEDSQPIILSVLLFIIVVLLLAKSLFFNKPEKPKELEGPNKGNKSINKIGTGGGKTISVLENVKNKVGRVEGKKEN